MRGVKWKKEVHMATSLQINVQRYWQRYHKATDFGSFKVIGKLRIERAELISWVKN